MENGNIKSINKKPHNAHKICQYLDVLRLCVAPHQGGDDPPTPTLKAKSSSTNQTSLSLEWTIREFTKVPLRK